MRLFPAIDIIGGRAVRLTKGEYSSAKSYGSPLDAAVSIKSAGAECLHIVDLDGAKAGGARNFELIKQLVAETALFTEVGGGIRDLYTAESYLNAGVKRIILGTAAVENPEFASDAVLALGAEAVAVGVDVKNGHAAVAGWTEESKTDGRSLIESLKSRGVRYFIYTDIDKDGALAGTNMRAYEQLSEIPDICLTASGGVTTYDELVALKKMGLYGAIIGKAMYEGFIDLRTALEKLRG